MDKERFLEILDDSGNDVVMSGDSVFDGLTIVSKYITNKSLIQGADHDIIYSVGINELVNSNITEDDVINLRKMNWIVMDNYLAHYV
jgi:hypothetical protein